MNFNSSTIRLLSILFFIFIINDLFAFKERLGLKCTLEKERKYCGDELICLNEICSFCRNDTDCFSKYNNFQCKTVLDPDTREYVKV